MQQHHNIRPGRGGPGRRNRHRSGSAGTLTGAGSTYVAPFLTLALAQYHQQHPAVTVTYSPVGSSAGIAAISARQVNFGASDVPMNASELAAAKGGPVTQVPDALGAEGIAYHLDLPAGARLHLTGPVLAAIYLGQVTRWNDPAITALNPGPASRARRSPSCTAPTAAAPPTSSATTSPASAPRGRKAVGTGKTLSWPVGEGAEGNDGVTTTVYRTPWSIGYVEQAYTEGLLLPFAEIRNQAGNYVLPTPQTIAAAAAQKPGITPADFSIVNQPGAGSYPISGYSWALIYTRQADQATGQALVTMLDWLTHDGQAYAAANLYVPLPSAGPAARRRRPRPRHRPRRAATHRITGGTQCKRLRPSCTASAWNPGVLASCQGQPMMTGRRVRAVKVRRVALAAAARITGQATAGTASDGGRSIAASSAVMPAHPAVPARPTDRYLRAERGGGEQADDADQRDAEQQAGRDRDGPGPGPAGDQRCCPAPADDGPGGQQPARGAPGRAQPGEGGQDDLAERRTRRSPRRLRPRVQALVQVMLAGLSEPVGQFLDDRRGQLRGQVPSGSP